MANHEIISEAALYRAWTSDRDSVAEDKPVAVTKEEAEKIANEESDQPTDFATMMAQKPDVAEPVKVDRDTARLMGFHNTKLHGVRFDGAWDRY